MPGLQCCVLGNQAMKGKTHDLTKRNYSVGQLAHHYTGNLYKFEINRRKMHLRKSKGKEGEKRKLLETVFFGSSFLRGALSISKGKMVV